MASAPFQPGGGFLFAPLPKVFSREDFSDDQRAFGETVERFYRDEVIPTIDAIEHKQVVEVDGKHVPYVVKHLKKAAELGLLMVDVGEEYGGMGLDKVTSMYMAECGIGANSMAVTIGAHIGIGTHPILFFGTHEQKAKYLPDLVTANKISCYALTEPGNGSDALNGKTTATRNPDGKTFSLNGSKQFITNAAFADYAVVFCNIDGQWSSLVVDLYSPGVTRLAEEKKAGIKGSSTIGLSFENVNVPVENMLGAVGDGPKIALNILNVGRLKLGFGCLGNARYALELSLKYGAERKQFGTPIIQFEAQKSRIAEMAARIFSCDSFAYFVAGELDLALAGLAKDEHFDSRAIAIIKAFAFEASIVKITGSETLAFCADQAVKLHGGYGFIEEYQVERLLRDNIVDMIFEGTNDINRLVIFDSFVRNVFGGSIGFREGLDGVLDAIAAKKATLSEEQNQRIIDVCKLTAAYVANAAIVQAGKDLKTKQMLSMAISDIFIQLSLAEASLLRVEKLIAAGDKRTPTLKALASLICWQHGQKVFDLARDALCGMHGAGTLVGAIDTLDWLAGQLPRTCDTYALKRTIADALIFAGKPIV